MPHQGRRIPTVLDTDIGSDIDDTWALLFMLARSDIFDIKLIQMSTGDTHQRAQITASILKSVGRSDVPIGIGERTDGNSIKQFSAAEGINMDEYVQSGGQVFEGTDYFEHLMEEATPSEPLYIIEIAPPKSLGDIIKSRPALAANCIVIAMSGSVYCGYSGSPPRSIEHNVKLAIPQTAAIYKTQWAAPLILAPLDSTVFLQFRGAAYQTLLAANDDDHPYVSTLMSHYRAWLRGGGGRRRPYDPDTESSTLFDVLAVYMAAQHAGWFHSGASFKHIRTVHNLSLQVDEDGHTLPAEDGAPKMLIAIDLDHPQEEAPAAGGPPHAGCGDVGAGRGESGGEQRGAETANDGEEAEKMRAAGLEHGRARRARTAEAIAADVVAALIAPHVPLSPL